MSYTQPDFLKNGGDAYRINAKSNERSRAEMCVFISVTSCAGTRRLLETSLNKLQIKIIEISRQYSRMPNNLSLIKLNQGYLGRIIPGLLGYELLCESARIRLLG